MGVHTSNHPCFRPFSYESSIQILCVSHLGSGSSASEFPTSSFRTPLHRSILGFSLWLNGTNGDVCGLLFTTLTRIELPSITNLQEYPGISFYAVTNEESVHNCSSGRGICYNQHPFWNRSLGIQYVARSWPKSDSNRRDRNCPVKTKEKKSIPHRTPQHSFVQHQ